MMPTDERVSNFTRCNPEGKDENSSGIGNRHTWPLYYRGLSSIHTASIEGTSEAQVPCRRKVDGEGNRVSLLYTIGA